MKRILFQRLLQRLRRNARGAAIVEFALIAPAFLALVVGIVQLGVIFLANAGLRNAVEDAARYATIWPRPTQAQVSSRITANRFGLDPAKIVGPTVTFTDSSPDYVTVSMTYNTPINYVFGQRTVSLTETRRAFVTE